MPRAREIHGLHGVHLNHGLEGIPSLNGFEWFRVVLSGVESFLVILRALVGSFLWCLDRLRGPRRVVLRAPEAPFFGV